MWQLGPQCPLCGNVVPLDRSATWPLRYAGALLHLRECPQAATLSEEQRAPIARDLTNPEFRRELPQKRRVDPAPGVTFATEGASPQSVLIVEDDRSTSGLLTEGLSPIFDCERVSDGVSALDELARRHYDAVLLDLMLPDVNGLEVLAEARDWDSDVRFIVITGGSHEMRLRAIALGAEQVIEKPFTIREVIAAIGA